MSIIKFYKKYQNIIFLILSPFVAFAYFYFHVTFFGLTNHKSNLITLILGPETGTGPFIAGVLVFIATGLIIATFFHLIRLLLQKIFKSLLNLFKKNSTKKAQLKTNNKHVVNP